MYFAEKRGVVKDCDSCRPIVSPSNYDATRVWDIVHDQLIIAPMGGPIGINASTAFEVMDRLRINRNEQLDCLGKLRIIFKQLYDEPTKQTPPKAEET